jgi:hypothetical protein
MLALSEQLDRLEAVIARKPELERQVESLQAQLAAVGGVWDGTSPAAIAAGIQDRLRAAVIGSGGRVKSTSEANEPAEHGFRKITVRFGIEGTIETVQQTLAAVLTTAPALFVDGFTIASAANDPGRERPPVLNLDLNVAGYVVKVSTSQLTEASFDTQGTAIATGTPQAPGWPRSGNWPCRCSAAGSHCRRARPRHAPGSGLRYRSLPAYPAIAEHPLFYPTRQPRLPGAEGAPPSRRRPSLPAAHPLQSIPGRRHDQRGRKHRAAQAIGRRQDGLHFRRAAAPRLDPARDHPRRIAFRIGRRRL